MCNVPCAVCVCLRVRAFVCASLLVRPSVCGGLLCVHACVRACRVCRVLCVDALVA